ncbi:glycoside hydrolase family 2 TIM barrel-domain containing protein [Psychroserpens sp. SPM9]|uniref:glycoside hydrolase family 2 TIM barrel-domain containing protein n=1 Tax=Psychroserpens sp. SPM9 TaxID=2975598 RepID=UPI0021A63F8B|nr:glycoside hydrolase family 2 TIM barrel-domain containing protein [Psychroserpens sp. SPM9]MDG5491344.1 glycoside hydrolase family 2 TIM barrel-domain containing protein [Psychroserpens sp. SPM9]
MRTSITLLVLSFIVMSCKSTSQNTTVSVKDSHIYVNDSLYTIKGICYHPVPKGSGNNRSFKTLTQDLALMTEAGINTIRVYAPIDDIKVLDEIHQAGIKVIMGFGYNQGGHYDIESGSFIDYVNTYKNHSAILMWELGNEYNYHPEWFGDDIKNWYKAMNDAAEVIHANDPNHPTTTAHGDLPDALALEMSPNIDVWGMNVYRWDNPESIFKLWKAVSSKPMYLSETGGDSYMSIEKAGYKQGENQKAQADAAKHILNKVFENTDICSGVTLFSFTDGWWKAGNNDTQDIGGYAPNSTGIPYDGAPNEEYWGIVDIDRNKKQVFNVLKEKYQSLNKN